MKQLFLLLFASLTFSSFAATPDLSHVRALFFLSADKEKKCKELLNLLHSYNEKKHPLFAGYKASATMMMAKHSFNPVNKLSYFNKGKKMLEAAIAADPLNPELRYLRYSIQENAPSFLGYRSHLLADKTFLQKHLHLIKDNQLKEMISKAIGG